MSDRVLHCWHVLEETICILLDGHDGDHEWTRVEEVDAALGEDTKWPH